MKVVDSDCLTSSTPQTIRLGACGEKGSPQRGEHISLPNDFLTMKNQNFGPIGRGLFILILCTLFIGKIFLNLWAQYRYGVYEEHGYPQDFRYPLIYYEKENVTTALPNACANIKLEGEFR